MFFFLRSSSSSSSSFNEIFSCLFWKWSQPRPPPPPPPRSRRFHFSPLSLPCTQENFKTKTDIGNRKTRPLLVSDFSLPDSFCFQQNENLQNSFMLFLFFYSLVNVIRNLQNETPEKIVFSFHFYFHFQTQFCWSLFLLVRILQNSENLSTNFRCLLYFCFCFPGKKSKNIKTPILNLLSLFLVFSQNRNKNKIYIPHFHVFKQQHSQLKCSLQTIFHVFRFFFSL